jgi:hypothetical protein
MHKIIKIVLVVVGLIGLVLWFMLPGREVPATEAVENGAINFMFMITYLLLGIAVIVSLIFALKNLFSSPASIKKTLFIVAGFALVVVIAYVLADGSDGTVEEMASRGITTTETTVKRIGTGLWVFFLLTIIAVGAMLWGGIRKMTK